MQSVQSTYNNRVVFTTLKSNNQRLGAVNQRLVWWFRKVFKNWLGFFLKLRTNRKMSYLEQLPRSPTAGSCRNPGKRACAGSVAAPGPQWRSGPRGPGWARAPVSVVRPGCAGNGGPRCSRRVWHLDTSRSEASTTTTRSRRSRGPWWNRSCPDLESRRIGTLTCGRRSPPMNTVHSNGRLRTG